MNPFSAGAGLRCRSTAGIGGDCGRNLGEITTSATSGPCLDLCLERDPDLAALRPGRTLGTCRNCVPELAMA